MNVSKPVQITSLAATISALLFFCCASFVSAENAQDTWQHELTIYGWYAGIDGAVKYPDGLGPGLDLTVEASDILDNLNMIFMGGWKSSYKKWSVMADVIYMDVGSSGNATVKTGAGVPVNASVDLDLKSWVLHGGIGYNVVQGDKGTMAVMGGVRYLSMDADVKVGIIGPGREKSGSESLLDGIIGVSGAITINENWYIPYHADIGGGASDLTWQLFAGVGYRFSWGDIRLGYRYLSYDLGDDAFMQDLDLSGPIMGVGFRF